MKYLVLFVIVITFFSCNKDDDIPTTDPDDPTGTELEFSLLPPDVAGIFQIDSATGDGIGWIHRADSKFVRLAILAPDSGEYNRMTMENGVLNDNGHFAEWSMREDGAQLKLDYYGDSAYVFEVLQCKNDTSSMKGWGARASLNGDVDKK